MIYRVAILAMPWVLGSFPGHAQQAPPTLRELVDSAIVHSHEMDNLQLDILTTGVDQKALEDAYLPQVSLTAGDAFLLSSFTVRSQALEIPQLNISFAEGVNRYTFLSDVATAGIAAKMLLYSGGKVPALKRAISGRIEGQKELTETQRHNIIIDIAATYDQLTLLAQTAIVLDEGKKRLAEHRRTADKTLQYGLSTNYEHQKIEVAQAQLDARIVEYNGRRALVLQKLTLLTGISPERLAAIDHPLHAMDIDSSGSDISRRPELRALNAFIRASGFAIQAEKTWFIPKVEGIGSIGYTGFLAGHINSSKPIVNGGDKLSASLPNVNVLPMATIGVAVKWDLLDGHTSSRAIQKATIAQQKLINQRLDAEEKLTLNLTGARTQWHTANSRMTLMISQRQTSWNALTQAGKEYRTGLIRSSQLIEAEFDYEDAALGYIQALYEQRRAALALLDARGELTIGSIVE